MAYIYCISDSLKIPKFLLLLSLRSENSFACVKLVNRSCVVVERKHVFNLSTDALVAGFTTISLHIEITSLISFLSGVDNSLILTTKDINLQYHKVRTKLKNCLIIQYRCLRYSLCLLCQSASTFANVNCNYTPLRTIEISSAILLLLYFIFILYATSPSPYAVPDVTMTSLS